ncbi:peroxidase 46-like [Papaver somniferum]|uniref:peroxidase 46-like n=1 Tax=Papaver somniferum TaxID=3469 RepID=UPI000E6FE04B|nr:peroxidase 46-like [Papaver somniferum]
MASRLPIDNYTWIRPSTQLKIAVIFVYIFLISSPSSSSGDLFVNFYQTSCPGAEFMVRNTVRAASNNDPTIPGKLLRLLFHDCIVEGCDGSVLLDGKETEKSDPANTSLGGFAVVAAAKELLELFCPSTVSCADIITLAARDAVAIFGGPSVEVPTGRRDAKVSLASNVRPNMVDTSFTMDQMTQLFTSKGLSLDDLVVLSGAHTIGAAHCNAFSDRFQENSKGELTLADKALDKVFASELMKRCPASASASITVNNDPGTSFVFDNQYYKNLIAHKGLFQSDSVLFSDARTKKLVEELSDNQDTFFQKWGDSFVRLSSVGVKTGDQGEIRRSCNVINQ